VPLRCSCGAVLPEDARFCHKCGQPQYEEDIARMNAQETPAPIVASVTQPSANLQPPARIGFSNRRAVRITLTVAGFSLLAISIIANLAPPLLFPILVAAGFTSVRVYLSRTAENLTASGGAALGAMTWLWLYLLEALGTAFVVFTAQGREIVKALKSPELAQLIDDPQKLVPTLILFLVIGAVSGAVGGVLAVRWQPRNGPSH
jgi:hypothetical protein